MTRVKLRLDKFLMDADLPEFGAVANIYDVSDRAGKPQNRRNIPIPVGSGGDRFTELDLEPGEYLVEAILPSGETISEEVSVASDPPSQELRLRAASSPHEWLGWQHFAGNTRQMEGLYRAEHGPPRVGAARGAPVPAPWEISRQVQADLVSTPPLPSDTQAQPNSPAALIARGYFFALPGISAHPVDQPLPAALLNASAHPLQVSPNRSAQDADDLSRIYRFDSGSLAHAAGGADTRHYLLISGQDLPPQYCVLPLPWPQADHSGEAPVEVWLRTAERGDSPRGGQDTAFRLSVSVPDRMVGAVLGYLASGDLPAAATLLRPARDMLFEKVANPLAAAGGGYVLLTAETPELPDYWHHWIQNLMNWFPWLPDGAIQHGWLTLRRPRTDQNLAEARGAFLEGFRRGLPFYAKGVSLLMDGLTLFANDARAAGQPDAELEQALTLVRQLAMRTNMRQAFTTVLLH
jgi:hypothetical protein